MTKHPGRNKLVHLFDIRAGDSLQHSRGGRVVSRATGWYSLRFGHSYSSHRQGGRHLDCTTSRLTPQRHRDYCLLTYRINNYTFAICNMQNNKCSALSGYLWNALGCHGHRHPDLVRCLMYQCGLLASCRRTQTWLSRNHPHLREGACRQVTHYPSRMLGCDRLWSWWTSLTAG